MNVLSHRGELTKKDNKIVTNSIVSMVIKIVASYTILYMQYKIFSCSYVYPGWYSSYCYTA